MELVHFYTAFGLSIQSEIILPPLVARPVGPVDVTIRRATLQPGPAPETTKIYRAGLQATFAQNDIDTYWLYWHPLMAFMARRGNELLVETNQADEELLALFTVSEAIGLILFQRGYFLLHGSAVTVNGTRLLIS